MKIFDCTNEYKELEDLKQEYLLELQKLKNIISELHNGEGLELLENNHKLREENHKLKDEINALKKEFCLLHMSSMFSTVKSFTGDVSERYKYDEETDNIYDTANQYTGLSKVLDKKEVTLLLNEYNALLECD